MLIRYKYLFLFLIFLIHIFLVKKYTNLFLYKFDESLLNRYFYCQDIPYEPDGKRIFLSDGQIHEAVGVLYFKGYHPIELNFQHPPLIKYLFGLSTILFNNPLYIQLLFSIFYILLTFLLADFVFDTKVGLLSSFLVAIDPLLIKFLDVALLDLGQATFLLLYIYLVLRKPKNWIFWSGIALGLSMASKFWAGSLFFIVLSFVFNVFENNRLNIKELFNFSFTKNLINKNTNLIKKYIYQLIIAFFVLCLTYIKTFIALGFRFNIIFFELKTLKYWFEHSVSSVPFASLYMFITGKFRAWWEKDKILKIHYYWYLWPISLFFTTFYTINYFFKNKFLINKKVFICLIPIFYLLYLGIQAPFERYFIVFLSYLYIGFSYFVFNFSNLK